MTKNFWLDMKPGAELTPEQQHLIALRFVELAKEQKAAIMAEVRKVVDAIPNDATK